MLVAVVELQLLVEMQAAAVAEQVGEVRLEVAVAQGEEWAVLVAVVERQLLAEVRQPLVALLLVELLLVVVVVVFAKLESTDGPLYKQSIIVDSQRLFFEE